jgi:hypothetical protein
MKRLTGLLFCLALTFSSLPSLAAFGQGNIRRPPDLDKYEPAASNSVEITIDEQVLRVAAGALSNRSFDEQAVKALLEGLKGVYVRAFEFDREGVYEGADVEALRSRFRAPGWSRVVGVRSKRYGDNVDVFLFASGGQVGGLAVVAAAPRELVYVEIEGPIDLERLRTLEGRFRIPRLDLFRDGKE